MMDRLLRDYWFFLRRRKRYWLLPLVLVLVALGVVAFLADDGAIAPLIYVN